MQKQLQNNKHKNLLNSFIILRIIFIVLIIACLMTDLYGVYSPTLYKIVDFTIKFDDGFAPYTIETLLVFMAGILFALSCALYFLEKYLTKNKKAYSKFNQACSDILFVILKIAILMAMAWHDFTIIVWPIIIACVDIINLNIKKQIAIYKLNVKPNKLLNFTILFEIICVCWILFLFNNMEYRDHVIMWWVIQNIFSYAMIALAIISCAKYGKSYLKAHKGKQYVK